MQRRGRPCGCTQRQMAGIAAGSTAQRRAAPRSAAAPRSSRHGSRQAAGRPYADQAIRRSTAAAATDAPACPPFCSSPQSAVRRGWYTCSPRGTRLHAVKPRSVQPSDTHCSPVIPSAAQSTKGKIPCVGARRAEPTALPSHRRAGPSRRHGWRRGRSCAGYVRGRLKASSTQLVRELPVDKYERKSVPEVNPRHSVASMDSLMSSSCCTLLSTLGQLAPTCRPRVCPRQHNARSDNWPPTSA